MESPDSGRGHVIQKPTLQDNIRPQTNEAAIASNRNNESQYCGSEDIAAWSASRKMNS